MLNQYKTVTTTAAVVDGINFEVSDDRLVLWNEMLLSIKLWFIFVIVLNNCRLQLDPNLCWGIKGSHADLLTTTTFGQLLLLLLLLL